MSPNYKAELVGVFGHPVSENPTVVKQNTQFSSAISLKLSLENQLPPGYSYNHDAR